MIIQSERKRKIALVLDDSLDTPDGVQQYVLTLGRWLAAEGHEVHYLVGETHRTDLEHLHSLGRNVHVRFNGNRMSIPLPVSKRRIRELMNREQFDVLHVQMPHSPMLGARLINAAGPRTAVVGTFHVASQASLVRVGNRLLAALVRRSLKRCDQLVSVSSVAQIFARRTFGLDSVVIPNMADLASFFAAKPEPHAALTQEKTIVFLGRLVERKGCAALLRAVTWMVERHIYDGHFRVIVGGRGPLESGLREFVAAHELDSIVQFAGFVEEQDKPAFLARADLAVFPSTGGESFGISLIEAMAAARGAVVAGDNPGYAGTMDDRRETLVDPRNEAAFARKLAAFLRDDAARKRAHDWQRAHVRQFDIAVVGPQLVAAYEAALHKRRA